MWCTTGIPHCSLCRDYQTHQKTTLPRQRDYTETFSQSHNRSWQRFFTRMGLIRFPVHNKMAKLEGFCKDVEDNGVLFVWGKAYWNLCITCIEERYKSPFKCSVITVKAVSKYLIVYLRGWMLFSSSELISISKISSVPAEEIWSSFLLSCLYFFLLLFFFFTEPGVNTVSVSTECGISEFTHVLSFSPDFKWLPVSLKNWSSVGIGDVAKYAGTFS